MFPANSMIADLHTHVKCIDTQTPIKFPSQRNDASVIPVNMQKTHSGLFIYSREANWAARAQGGERRSKNISEIDWKMQKIA
jgi:hypothetical protein